MKCTNCGHPNRANVQFCEECGTQLPQAFSPTKQQKAEQICQNCKTKNRIGAKFCENCGQALAVQAVALIKPQKQICPKCGTKNRPGVQFCENCGQQLGTEINPSHATQSVQTAAKKGKPSKKRTGLLIGAGIVIVALAVAILLILTRSRPLPMFGESSGSSNTGTIQEFFTDLFHGINNANSTGNDGNPEPGTIQGFFDDLFNGSKNDNNANSSGSAISGSTGEKCTNEAELISQAIPEDTVVHPGEVLNQTWRLRNIGTCTWTTKYGVKRDSEASFSDWPPAPEFVPLSHSVAPGQEIDVSIQIPIPDETWLMHGRTYTADHEYILVNNQGESVYYYMSAKFRIDVFAFASRCSLFSGVETNGLGYFDWTPGSIFTFYFNISGGVPGLEKQIPDDTSDWVYTTKIGDYSGTCDYEGYKEMLFCNVNLPASYSSTRQNIDVWVNGCNDPIYSYELARLPGIVQQVQQSSGSACSQPGSNVDNPTNSVAWEAYCKCIGKSEAISGGTIHCE